MPQSFLAYLAKPKYNKGILAIEIKPYRKHDFAMSKLGRNDLCWCQSSIKYKKCHAGFDRRLNDYRRRGTVVPLHEIIKNPVQIQGIRESAKINIAVLDYVSEHIKTGITTEQINTWVYEQTVKYHAIPAPLNYNSFPKSICTSINDQVCHGIPSDDIVSVSLK